MNGTDKRIKWKKADYFRTIIAFVFSTLVIFTFMLALLAVKIGGIDKIGSFLTGEPNLKLVVFSFLTVVLAVTGIYLYFYNQHRDFMYKTSNVIMIFSVLILSLVANYLFGKINLYIRPFALCALLTLMLRDKRTAVFMNCVFAIIMLSVDVFVASFNVAGILASLIITFTSGIIAVYLIDGEGSRAKVLIMGFLISLPVIISAFCLEFSANLTEVLLPLLFALGSGVISDALMMITIPFFEIFFGALTNFRLTELTDHKAKLIRELSLHAPGTFSHTIIVAMLAEACGNAIGENPLLMRACAYYHDVGKLKKPEFFTENQTGKNPHDDLSPELSTDIIRSHAKDGADLIRRRRLPEVLATAAEQHHGTLPIRYFYVKASKFTDGKLSLENFSYYGPKPQNKANAIIMICDACEAKVRTMKDRSHENVDKAVKDIIEERMDMEQFTECDITFRELDVLRNTITNTLSGVYHERVKYPKLKTGGKRA